MQDFLQGISQEDKNIESLVGMGFPEAVAKTAVIRCGMLSISVAATFLLVLLINKFPSLSMEREICQKKSFYIVVKAWYYFLYLSPGTHLLMHICIQ
jgi:hypothetical protein